MSVKVSGPLVGRFSTHKVKIEFIGDLHNPHLRILGAQGQPLATLYLALRGDELLLGINYENHPHLAPDSAVLALLDLDHSVPF